MSAVWRELERDEHRVLAAIECVDGSTGARISEPLLLRAPGARFVHNHSGLHVLHSWTPLAAHSAAFAAPPATPAVGAEALDVRISDPAGTYMPRDARLLLPRDPDPANAALAASLFRPQRIQLLRAAAAPLGRNWATLFLSIAASNNGDALGGALIEVNDAQALPLARGVSDWRGECVLPVVGVPVTTWGDGEGDDPVVVAEIPATVRVRWPAVAGTRVPQAAVAAGRAPARLPIIDPDRLPAAPVPIVTNPVIDITLAAGRAQALRVVLPAP